MKKGEEVLEGLEVVINGVNDLKHNDIPDVEQVFIVMGISALACDLIEGELIKWLYFHIFNSETWMLRWKKQKKTKTKTKTKKHSVLQTIDGLGQHNFFPSYFFALKLVGSV